MLSRKLSWGEDPEHDAKLILQLAALANVPEKTIWYAVIDHVTCQLVPYRHPTHPTVQ